MFGLFYATNMKVMKSIHLWSYTDQAAFESNIPFLHETYVVEHHFLAMYYIVSVVLECWNKNVTKHSFVNTVIHAFVFEWLMTQSEESFRIYLGIGYHWLVI